MALADRGAAAVRRVPPGWLGAAGVVFFLVLPAACPARRAAPRISACPHRSARCCWDRQRTRASGRGAARLGAARLSRHDQLRLLPVSQPDSGAFRRAAGARRHVAIPKIVRDTLPEMLQFALAVLLAHLSAIWKSGCSISSRSPRCWPGISSHGRARRRVEHGTFAATVERGSGASRHTPALTLNTPTIASSTGAGKTMRSRTSMRIAQSNRRSCDPGARRGTGFSRDVRSRRRARSARSPDPEADPPRHPHRPHAQ